MKKTILIISIIFLTFSCSDDRKDEFDIRDDLSYLNFQNEQLKGIWYYDKVIQADGIIENYVHICPLKRDYVDFQSYKIQDYFHWDNLNCNYVYSDTSCQNFIIQGYNLTICNSRYEGTYTFSGNTLRVDYDEVENFTQPDNNLQSVRGLIFARN